MHRGSRACIAPSARARTWRLPSQQVRGVQRGAPSEHTFKHGGAPAPLCSAGARASGMVSSMPCDPDHVNSDPVDHIPRVAAVMGRGAVGERWGWGARTSPCSATARTWQPKQTPSRRCWRAAAAASSARRRTTQGSSLKESAALPVTTTPCTHACDSALVNSLYMIT